MPSVEIGGRTCRLLAAREFGDAGEVILRGSEKTQTSATCDDKEEIKWRSGSSNESEVIHRSRSVRSNFAC